MTTDSERALILKSTRLRQRMTPRSILNSCVLCLRTPSSSIIVVVALIASVTTVTKKSFAGGNISPIEKTSNDQISINCGNAIFRIECNARTNSHCGESILKFRTSRERNFRYIPIPKSVLELELAFSKASIRPKSLICYRIMENYYMAVLYTEIPSRAFSGNSKAIIYNEIGVNVTNNSRYMGAKDTKITTIGSVDIDPPYKAKSEGR